MKYGFFAYNGVADVYKDQATKLGFTSAQANNGEGSPYVMNRYDKMRDPTVEPTKSNGTWGQIKTDRGKIIYPANSDYGAYVVYRSLLEARSQLRIHAPASPAFAGEALVSRVSTRLLLYYFALQKFPNKPPAKLLFRRKKI